MKKRAFKILNKHVKILIRWKKQKGDSRLPSHKKDNLLVQWNETKSINSPQVSPYSSDAESEDSEDKEVAYDLEEEESNDSEDEESEEKEINNLVFDSDESDDDDIDDSDNVDFVKA